MVILPITPSLSLRTQILITPLHPLLICWAGALVPAQNVLCSSHEFSQYEDRAGPLRKEAVVVSSKTRNNRAPVAVSKTRSVMPRVQ